MKQTAAPCLLCIAWLLLSWLRSFGFPFPLPSPSAGSAVGQAGANSLTGERDGLAAQRSSRLALDVRRAQVCHKYPNPSAGARCPAVSGTGRGAPARLVLRSRLKVSIIINAMGLHISFLPLHHDEGRAKRRAPIKQPRRSLSHEQINLHDDQLLLADEDRPELAGYHLCASSPVNWPRMAAFV